MNLKEIVINMRNCIDSAQDRDYWEYGIETPGSIVSCIVLMGWSLLSNALRPFQDLLCSPEFRYY